MSSRIILGLAVIFVIFGGLLSFMFYWRGTIRSEPQACTMEAKICPDGSAVGRTGPHCEFSPCPDTATTSSSPDVTLGIGQQATFSGLTIIVNSFVQDNRCPIDVVCIEAGAVTVNVTLKDFSKIETRNMPSDEVPYVFDGYQVSITSVVPPRESQKEIPNGAYQITFHIKAPAPVSSSNARGYLVGQVTVSPTCPVESVPPKPECAPKPYAALIDISGMHNFFIEIHADVNGFFSAPLPVGTYTITTHQTSIYPSCLSQKVSITALTTTTANISCDSGIR